jgi:hypothetical protein
LTLALWEQKNYVIARQALEQSIQLQHFTRALTASCRSAE